MVAYHEIPCGVFRLGVEGLVPGTDGDVFSGEQAEGVDIEGPETPAPVFAILVGFFWVVEGADLPGLAAVDGDFHSCDLPSTAYTIIRQQM
ncbi:hypothetical protein MA16_Dca023007 [Dendrobium catenatum]|uniref:Uncharacterized protein n=1 Tax=Dendrobium catenatum TaxID=906689 RepID=A0A2I0WJ34_9ASPA|nr:hypothetical protein MA16_Dca023007 [Dendrobium catenatum]